MHRLMNRLNHHKDDTSQDQPPLIPQDSKPPPPVPERNRPLQLPDTTAPPQTGSFNPPPDAPQNFLNIGLQNQTNSGTVYAYITGRAIDRNNDWILLKSNGQDHYYPINPPSVGTPIAENCAIPLGPPGSTTFVTIPHVAGGRIWFSVDTPLTFLLNPGPALVEPSVTNPSDPNINTSWGFCEFTYNHDQLYANISYVDFVGLPISISLRTQANIIHHVSGMPPNGLDKICDGLRGQSQADGKGWDKLVVQKDGRNLRALSPNLGMVGNPGLWDGYYEPYIEEAWSHLSHKSMAIDTQASFGIVSAKMHSNSLDFAGSKFSKPSTRDIFSCNSGPFQCGPNAQTNTIIPRLAAAFNRSTVMQCDKFPEDPCEHYRQPVTNHYSRIVHEANLDGKGYAFPYDDVLPSGGKDQSGEVHAGDPKLFLVVVGGGRASVDPPAELRY